MIIKKVFIAIVFVVFFLVNTANATADHGTRGENEFCLADVPYYHCKTGFSCKDNPDPNSADKFICQRDVFGTIQPPDAIKNLIGTDPTGAGGISKFLSNLVGLIYVAASIVLIFMILWGAWDWMTSEGDKEKLDSARKKIINALVGILLFAVAFAIIQVLGQFTGFKFFQGQKP